MVPVRAVCGFLAVTSLLLSAGCNCGGAGGDTRVDAGADGGEFDAGPCPTGTGPGTWTWVSGSSEVNGSAVYGTLGTPAPDNVPGPRQSSATWLGADGSLWLFGGDSPGGQLDDLWRFDGTSWTWVSGSSSTNQRGVYGTRGVADPLNVPGARYGAVTWTDASGRFWLFGGYGYDATAKSRRPLNDLWRFDGARWTWVKGSNAADQPADYGALGVAADTNDPGARTDAVGWTDSGGNFWLFGGNDMMAGGAGSFADLWRFDGSRWSWMRGPAGAGGSGHLGVLGVPDRANAPPDVSGGVAWVGRGDALWLFGGSGYACGNMLNELWRSDGSDWTWMGGLCKGSASTFGPQGVPSPASFPGARGWASAWRDHCGDGWVFGGADGSDSNFDDLWKYDGTNWTWVAGVQGSGSSEGTYGTKGSPDAANFPGGRSGAVTWTDASGASWLFGGSGYDSKGSFGLLNDLWIYQP